jgi:peptidoglycan glycosyltransferase
VLLEEQQIKRGVIRAADGTVLAGSRAVRGPLRRRYPTGELFAHPSASTTSARPRPALERYYNDR